MRRAAPLIAVGAIGCNALLGYTPPTVEQPEAAVEASTYAELADDARWSTFDLATIASSTSWAGGTFDGRYVYFAPGAVAKPNGVVVRCDTTLPYGANAWDSFDLAAWVPNLRGYEGAVTFFEHVYFVPHDDGLFHGRVVSYRRYEPFAEATSWDTVDLATEIGPSAVGFGAGATDGRYVYFTPFAAGTVVRYDTSAPFGWSTSYEAYHLSDNYRWRGAAYDGRYVYFVPRSDTQSSTFGAIARFDTTASVLDDAHAWRTFDLTTYINARAYGFFGAVFDGRWLYLVPASDTVALRFDTQAELDDRTAWTSIDLATVATGARGYAGGVFDGRYVYFAPTDTNLVLRYDTTQSFALPSAFQFFDPTSLDARAHGFSGAVFDGSSVYFVPSQGTVTARFRARDTRWEAPSSASFY